jgi:hypothetical protein
MLGRGVGKRCWEEMLGRDVGKRCWEEMLGRGVGKRCCQQYIEFRGKLWGLKEKLMYCGYVLAE